jgi:hypothetical protein
MELKICSKCKKEKPINEFFKRSDRKSGHVSWCNTCMSNAHKEWRIGNPEKIKNWWKNNPDKKHKYSIDWRENNPKKMKDMLRKYRENNREMLRERAKQYKIKNPEVSKTYYKNNAKRLYEKQKEFYKNNPDKRIENQRKNYLKVLENPTLRLSRRIASSIRQTLKNSSKGGCHWEEFFDYSIQDLKQHLENQFKPGMSWDNRGKWHIDHIVPVSYFKFDSPYDDEFQVCWSLSNLRPLWAGENMRKNNKLNSVTNEELKRVAQEFINLAIKNFKQARGLLRADVKDNQIEKLEQLVML